MYVFKNITINNLQPFATLMPPSLYSGTITALKNENMKAIGVEYNGLPIGLGMLECNTTNPVAYMRSLFIKKVHRRLGVATEILRKMREFCKVHHIHTIRFHYYSGKTTTDSIESWLTALGATKPSVEAVVFHIDHSISEAPWLKNKPLPKGLQLVPWLEIDPLERQQLHTKPRHAYPAFLSPFKNFAPTEKLNSLGIMSDAGIEGWSISYRPKQEIILYDALYVAPPYQQSGLAFILLSEAILLHLEYIDKIPYGLFAVNTSTPSMLKIANKWLKPYAAKSSEKRMSELYV